MQDEPSSARAARLTAPGRSAIATISVDGRGALQHVVSLFHPQGSIQLEHVAERRVVFGRWSAVDWPSSEEVVVCVHGPSRVEIHCHGGEAAATRILQSLGRAGCRLLTAEQWLAAGDKQLLEQEAMWALTQAATPRVAAVLIDQLRGALQQQVERTLEQLVEGDLVRARTAIRTLLERSHIGCHLIDGWQVVLVGRPNVGKSSLVNALLGYQRAIVYDRAGTTRDVVTAGTAIDGWPVRFSDTAGIARDAETVEAAGVELAWQRVDAADLVVFVSDASDAWAEEDELILRRVGDRALIVHNKSDLAPQPPTHHPAGILTSAALGHGIQPLLAAISQRLVPAPPQPGDPVPFNQRQTLCLRQAIAALESRHAEATRQALHRLVHGSLGESGATARLQ